FMISTAALIGIFPLAGFWSKDEILASASQLGGGSLNYKAFLLVGVVGAAMTAAYMTRAVYLTFFGEYRGEGQPHESGPRITVPLWILAGLAVAAGVATVPNTDRLSCVPDGIATRFEHFYEPVGAYLPRAANGFAHPEVSIGVALLYSLIELA